MGDPLNNVLDFIMSDDSPLTPEDAENVEAFDRAVRVGEARVAGWNFDIASIPRGRRETHTRIVKGEPQEYEVFVPERVLIAHPRDGKVYATTWVEPNKWHPKGRWMGWTEGTEPVAWQHYPEHPHPTPSTEKERAAS